MNYFASLARSRQAALGFACAAILFIATPVLAQEDTTPVKLNPETTETMLAQQPEETETTTAQIRLTRSSFNRISPDVKKIGDFSFGEKPPTAQQSQQDDDDTMEGVMGKRPAKARIGGHVGFVLPLVARGGGSTALPIVDNFTIGFPVGLTVRTNSPVAFDFEFIPTINTPGRNNFFLTIHPGIIYGFKKKYAVGLRGAYDAGNNSYGFTPLISRGYKINDKLGFFIEADFPIRWNQRETGGRFASGAFAAHFGLAF